MNKNIDLNLIKSELGKLSDPDIDKSLDELSAVKEVKLDGDLLKITIELIQPIHWAAEKINIAVDELIKKYGQGIEYELSINEKPFDLGERQFLKKVKNIIAVASGKGGVGKSAIASNLALALSKKGANVGILDGDVYGPSQPTMFDLVGKEIYAVEQPDGKTVAYPNEQYGIKVASMGFIMNRDEAAIVRGPLLAGYFSMLFEQIDWGDLDFLVFDLPPGTGDVQLTLTQKIPLTGSVIVTTPQEIAVADVRRSITMFNRVNVDILGVVENMSYFVPDDMPDKKYYIFGQGGGKQVASENNVNFLGEVPLSIAMRENNDNGKPIVESDENSVPSKKIIEISEKVVSDIRKLNYKKMETPDVKISV